ncbi:monocarboxylate transporter 12-B-like [Tubulanus polymorphus]|uniref:monocarboxylate transporter 12-B-like n=1 Tax=Tubulanus polymorphus TaxID=672921 RepID=UPI003DA447AF
MEIREEVVDDESKIDADNGSGDYDTNDPGLCQALFIGPVIAYIMIRFRRYRSIANAFVVSATSLGTIVFGVIINKSIEAYTWRGAVLLLGALSLNMAPCALILRNWNKRPHKEGVLLSKQREGESPNELTAGAEKRHDTNSSFDCRNVLHLDVLKQPIFLSYSFAIFFLFLAGSMIMVHIVSGFMYLCKLELEEARYLVPCLGTSNLIGRFVVSIISHHPRVDTLTLFQIVNILFGVTVAIVPLFKGFTAAAILVVIIGMVFTSFGALKHLVLAEMIEERYIHMSVQYMFFVAGIGYMIGGPLAGWIYDVTGNYVYSFELTASLLGVSVLVLLPSWFKHIRQLKKESPVRGISE